MQTIAVAERHELTGFALMAHVMGMAAHARGETALDNPFTEEPDCSAAWLDGWMKAGASGRRLHA
ncbi:hypothetical protein [Oleisolibacter albus]|uniref:hypothetical protein n=1 Tax=Oleisolibacter albus TaxID=2171757 RepID=UPI000DF1DB88|nr:hypothetical protein [Oleisolibacter albus]